MDNKKTVVIAVLLVAAVCMRYPLRFERWIDDSFNSPQFYLGYAAVLILAIILVIDFIIISRKKQFDKFGFRRPSGQNFTDDDNDYKVIIIR